MDDLVWDLEMAYGQIRPVDRARLKTIKESFMRSPPLQLLHCLVVSKGHESMLQSRMRACQPFVSSSNAKFVILSGQHSCLGAKEI